MSKSPKPAKKNSSPSPSKRQKREASPSPKWHRKSPTSRLVQDDEDDDENEDDDDDVDDSIAASVKYHPRSRSPSPRFASEDEKAKKDTKDAKGKKDKKRKRSSKKKAKASPSRSPKAAPQARSPKAASSSSSAPSSSSSRPPRIVPVLGSSSSSIVGAPTMYATHAEAAAAYEAALNSYNGVGDRPREDFFYNHVAAQSIIRGPDVSTDVHGNPLGPQFDLAREGIYNGFTVVIGQFYSDHMWGDAQTAKIVGALKAKGFTVRHTKQEDECAKWLNEASAGSPDCAWIISNRSEPLPALISACKAFHARGKGLFLFGDNDPYYAHANAILSDLFDGLKLGGNYLAQKQLKSGTATSKGEFGTHLIFTGIEHLYEGVTIAHPLKVDPRFEILATASDGNTCIQVYDPIPSQYNTRVATDSGCGRIAIDCAFTKLYIEWSTAGTARYIVNATCWLIGIERSPPKDETNNSQTDTDTKSNKPDTELKEVKSDTEDANAQTKVVSSETKNTEAKITEELQPMELDN